MKHNTYLTYHIDYQHYFLINILFKIDKNRDKKIFTT